MLECVLKILFVGPALAPAKKVGTLVPKSEPRYSRKVGDERVFLRRMVREKREMPTPHNSVG